MKYIYQNKLNKPCSQHDVVYGANKYLPRKTASDKVLFNNKFTIARNPYYDGYQRRLASVVEYFLDKKLRDATSHTGAGTISDDQQLTD